MIQFLLIALLLTGSPILLLSQDPATKLVEPRNITVKAPASKVELTLAIPDLLKEDKPSAAKHNAIAIFDPAGKDVESANTFLTVEFDPKGLADNSTTNLKTYFRYQMAQLTGLMPNAQFVHWQPPHLNPDKVNFMAIDIKPVPEKHFVAEHMVTLEVADGFYTLAVHANDPKVLDNVAITDIFDSLEGLNPDRFMPPEGFKPQPTKTVTVPAPHATSSLVITLPADFKDDKRLAAKQQYLRAYAPGGDGSSTDRMISVAFYSKSHDDPSLVDLDHTLAWWKANVQQQFPNAVVKAWSPEATKLPQSSFRSVSIDGDAAAGDPISEVMLIETSSGYFMVVAYAGTPQILTGKEMAAIMSSVSLQP